MKKRVSALLLALCLMTSPALAAKNSTDNFTRTRTYAGKFSDLPADSAFYDNVSALYEYGLSQGNLDGTYGINARLTVGQAIIFAGRIRSLYCTGSPEAGPAAYQEAPQLAAVPYLRYLRSEGIPLDDSLETQLTMPATRAQMAHILANILPDEVLPNVHDTLVTEGYATRRCLTDVDEYTPYFQDILSLYRKGICMGNDRWGTFRPDAYISRGAAAAMLTRIMDPDLRVSPQWNLNDPPAPAGSTLSALVEPGTYIASPANANDLESSIRYMLSTGSNQLTLYYPNITAAKARELLQSALTVLKQYCEQSYNSGSCTFLSQGTVTLTFASTSAESQLPAYRDYTMAAAIAVREQLWAAGALTEDMTDMEKAYVYFNWICENCKYDYSAGDQSLSHLPYSLFKRGIAVCDGYTGAYNLLLKLEGIECTSVFTSSHIWTSAILDGTEYHIDTTWADDGNNIHYIYFAMTPEQSRLYHS